MADENQNTEMEDILSSIKNILEEDNGGLPAEAKVAPSVETDVVDDLLNSAPEVDDILELSPDMRIEQSSPSATEAESVDVSLPEIENGIADGFNIGIEDETSDSVFDEALDISAEIEHPLNTEFEQTAEPEPVVEIADTAEENTAAAVEAVEQTTVDEYLDAPVDNNEATDFVIEPATFNDAEPPADEQAEQISVIETEIAPVLATPVVDTPVTDAVFEETADTFPVIEEVAEQAPVFEEIAETPVAEPSVEESAPAIEEQETAAIVEEPVEQAAEEDKKTDVADVSAGIISNFAKMFAKEEPAAPVMAEAERVTITSAGNTGKTLEEFVLDSISKVIGQEISRQWNDGAAFKALAEAEINRQTREWINDNLPALVEKVVKQEIERVIAKVGS